MDEDYINYMEKEIFLLASSSGKEELAKKISQFFKYVAILEKANKSKDDKIIKLYEDNMLLHKEIVLLLANKEE